ncbi:uncharacterized protein LOC128960174 [Oppia nitens]|uniref:uncharacterized protein LOC128960174 n=1 Tax=Oppia nitens TaxID=1686743 RepID=UPI0023DC5D41|nr:uncharacterized protein LOC128960174 [Oppia nitens]
MFIHLIYSISFSSFGPAFVDLTYTLDVSLQLVSIFPTVLAVGHITGTLFGLIYKFFNRQLIITLLLYLMTLSSTSVPFTTTIWQYYLCALGYGIGSGAWMTTYNVWLMEMWQDKSERVLFISQLIYGIGATIGPFIDAPYLTGDNQDITVAERKAKLFVPFVIIGGIQVIFPIIMTIMFFLHRYHKQNILEDDTSAQSVDYKSKKLFDKSDPITKYTVVVLAAVSLASINSLELVYFNFGSTFFQKIPVHMSATIAANVISTLSSVYTACQVINLGIALLINRNIMIAYHYVITSVAIIALIFVQYSVPGVWVLAVIVGYGFSLLYPGILASVGTKLTINNRVGTIIWFISGAFNFVPPLILGPLLESFPMIFVVTQVIYLIISAMFLI